jgi:hypothetical protein
MLRFLPDTARDYIYDATEYVSDTARSVARRVSAYIEPIPTAPTSPETVWKYYEYPRFVPKDSEEEELRRQIDLIDFLKVPANRALLDDHNNNNYLHKYVLCALHQADKSPAFEKQLPGLGLDLMTIYGCRSQHDRHIINHYTNTVRGNPRDGLFATALKMIEQDSENEHTLRAALKNPLSLLRLALEEHRLPASYKAISGHNPDTISELNELLRQREHKRISKP